MYSTEIYHLLRVNQDIGKEVAERWINEKVKKSGIVSMEFSAIEILMCNTRLVWKF